MKSAAWDHKASLADKTLEPAPAGWGRRNRQDPPNLISGYTTEHNRWYQPRMDPMLDTEGRRYNYEEWVQALQKHWCQDRRGDPRWFDLWDH